MPEDTIQNMDSSSDAVSSAPVPANGAGESAPVVPAGPLPSQVLGAHTTAVPPKFPNAAGIPEELRKVVESAETPCRILLKSEADARLVAQMIGSNTGYDIRVNSAQQARAMWRKKG